jgi:hypothetical protein
MERSNKELRMIAYDIHEYLGQFALYDWANKRQLPYTYCKECDTDVPYITIKGAKECLSCGGTVK